MIDWISIKDRLPLPKPPELSEYDRTNDEEALKESYKEKYIHWCDDCPKAYDDTCSGADAAKCEAEKNQFLSKGESYGI